jgi:hypothetical protein
VREDEPDAVGRVGSGLHRTPCGGEIRSAYRDNPQFTLQAAPALSPESLLGSHYAKPEANKETVNQIIDHSPSDDSTTMISVAPGARGLSYSDWSGRDIAS